MEKKAFLKFEMPSALLPSRAALKSIWELEIGFRLFKGRENASIRRIYANTNV
jgi:hypothetical protein